MFYKGSSFFLILLLFVFLCSPGCVHTGHYNLKETKAFSLDINSAQYKSEIERLEESIQNHPEESVRTNAHLKLTWLYASYKNPSRDFLKAIEHLNIYISRIPNATVNYDVQNWMFLLKEIERLGKINRKSEQQKRKCKKDITTLTNENKKLKGMIEELENLELKLEQKRKRFKY